MHIGYKFTRHHSYSLPLLYLKQIDSVQSGKACKKLVKMKKKNLKYNLTRNSSRFSESKALAKIEFFISKLTFHDVWFIKHLIWNTVKSIFYEHEYSEISNRANFCSVQSKILNKSLQLTTVITNLQIKQINV